LPSAAPDVLNMLVVLVWTLRLGLEERSEPPG